MGIKSNEKIMNEKCLCECDRNKKIIKHLEKCSICNSVAYHHTPKELNQLLQNGNKRTRR